VTSRPVAILGFTVMVGFGIYGYYRDPLGSLPVALMITGFVMMLIGLGMPSKDKGGYR
jgi:membrane-bound ClpP family serine protease